MHTVRLQSPDIPSAPVFDASSHQESFLDPGRWTVREDAQLAGSQIWPACARLLLCFFMSFAQLAISHASSSSIRVGETRRVIEAQTRSGLDKRGKPH
jgi:hypothetical protein